MKIKDIKNKNFLLFAIAYACYNNKTTDIQYITDLDLKESFVWSDTHLGHEFWSDLYFKHKESKSQALIRELSTITT